MMQSFQKLDQAFIAILIANGMVHSYDKNQLSFTTRCEFDYNLPVVISTCKGKIPYHQILTINSGDIDIIYLNKLHCALGAFFLTAHDVFEFEFKDATSLSDDLKDLKTIIRQCRNAYAHNFLDPHWAIGDPYRGKPTKRHTDERIVLISHNERTIKIDLSTKMLCSCLNGCLDYRHRKGIKFDLEQIGGYLGLYTIYEKLRSHIK